MSTTFYLFATYFPAPGSQLRKPFPLWDPIINGRNFSSSWDIIDNCQKILYIDLEMYYGYSTCIMDYYTVVL